MDTNTPEKKNRGKGIGHEIYPMRVVGYLVLCIELWLAMRIQPPKIHFIYIAWIVFFFLYPHLIFQIYRYFKARNDIERAWLVLDLFWIGIVVVMISFSLMPTMALIVYSTATCIGIGGVSMWLKGLATLGVSQLLMWFFWGNFYVTSNPSVWSNIIGFMYMFIGFNAYNFAYYRRSIAFKKIRMQIEKQKAEIAEQKEEIESTLGLVEIERQKSDELLLNILPKSIAQELKNYGFATPKRFNKATVLFTDFKGFTQIVSKMEPEQVLDNLNYCFTAFDKIIRKYNLEKIKTIGDAYMCVGGLPTEDENNPIRAVEAALEILAFMKDWKAKKIKSGKEVWDIRLGIHTGTVIAGVVGQYKFAYDIWGDTVNVASRMESSGEAGKVNISGTTYELVKHQFMCTYRGAIQAKNKGEVEMYFVENKI